MKTAGLHSTVDSVSDCRSWGHKFKSLLGHITFVETDHEILPTGILPILLIQEWQLSVIVKVCARLVNHLEDSLPRKKI